MKKRYWSENTQLFAGAFLKPILYDRFVRFGHAQEWWSTHLSIEDHLKVIQLYPVGILGPADEVAMKEASQEKKW